MALTLRDHHRALLAELRIEPLSQPLRVTRGDRTVAATSDALLVWEPRRIVPVYAVPEASVSGTLTAAGPPVGGSLEGLPPVLGPGFDPHTTPGQPLDLALGDEVLAGVAFRPDDPDLAGHVTLDLHPFAWWEEDQEVWGHPHDPYKRIDTLVSHRHVVVSFQGTVLADSRRAVALLETSLPTRWYVPAEDVRLDLLEPSPLVTTCAYKGHASYLSVRGAGEEGRDLAWSYADPLNDAVPVRDLLCFWSERTDLTLDGEPQPRPVTPWSRRDD